MKLSRLTAILILTVVLLTANGCSLTENFLKLLPAKPVYVKEGQVVEMAERGKYKVWVTNKESGKKELRTLDTRNITGTVYIGRLGNAEN